MNRISIYVLLILIFLGLSKSFAPSERKTHYIINERVFANFFPGSPISLILIDSFHIGFIIKTYFQTYKVIHGFKIPEKVTVRTSSDFWKKNLKNIGMSLFRREGDNESSLPLPPGSLYVGNFVYGSWRFLDSGKKIWQFHRAYRHFPKLFGWGKFKPDFLYFEKLKIYQENNSPFYGNKNEFGMEGSVTKKNILSKVKKKEKTRKSFREYFKKFIHLPWRKNE